jgi:hypothetical protein
MRIEDSRLRFLLQRIKPSQRLLLTCSVRVGAVAEQARFSLARSQGVRGSFVANFFTRRRDVARGGSKFKFTLPDRRTNT